MRLGDGQYEAFIYDRGGKTSVGRLTQIAYLKWERLRDAVSGATVRISGPDLDCSTLLANTRAVRHELVIFRDGKRVWEGPIIRLAYTKTGVEIEARDILWFASRRIQPTAIDHSAESVSSLDVMYDITTAMFDDPPDWANALDYIEAIRGATGDARTLLKVEPYSRTVLDILEGFATNGGMDYTVVGRRIAFWDTHTRVAVMTPLDDSHFTSPLTVTEHGSDLETRRFNRGQSGNVSMRQAPVDWQDYYGLIDKVNAPDDEKDIAAGLFSEGPELDTGFPSPLRINVPDNSGLSHDAPVAIEQLVPGTWVTIRSSETARDVEQWMKVQAVSGTTEGAGEQIAVTFLEAPPTWQNRWSGET